MNELERFANPHEDKIAELRKGKNPVNSVNIHGSAGMHISPSIAIAYAHAAVEHLKAELADNLVAAYVVGKAGRNSEEKIDKAKMIIVIKDRDALPPQFKETKVIPRFGSVQPNIVTQEELDSLLEGNSTESKKHRADLALDNIALHGIGLVRKLRRKAFGLLQEEDFEPIVSTLAKNRLKARSDKHGKGEGLRESIHMLKQFKGQAYGELGVKELLIKAREIQQAQGQRD